MEDSYTVHRRRKAAAKKREKTPEPSEYPANEEEASEDDGEARKKMEQMVEDTERMQEDVVENKSDSKNSAGELTEETEKTVEVERESPEVEVEKPLRTRRRRDNQDELSDAELQKRALRKKSPEEAKLRSERKKTPSKTRKEVDDEGREKRGSSRHRHSGSEEENGSRRTHRRKDRSTSRHAYSSESDEGRSSKPRHKKQVILLRDDSLMDDLVKAEKEYVKREYSLEDEDEEEKPVRRRKPQKEEKTAEEEEEVEKPKRSWFSWVPFFGRKKEKVDEPVVDVEPVKEEVVEEEKVTIWEFFRAMIFVVSEFKEFTRQNPGQMKILLELRNTCLNELILGLIYCGVGGLIFRFTEGAFESFYKCGVKRVKRDFLDSLWSYSHSMKEEDWKSMARRKLMEFEEQIHTAHEAGVQSYSGQRSWTFLNAVVYCITVVTTIGYGHISPSTTTGRAITIIYAIFGIPMFLIILADFGKLFTRCIKFLWAFVRRVYYTGSCRKVRRTVPVQEVMKGVQLVYDLATFRRPSQMNPEDLEEMQKQAGQSHAVLNLDGNASQPDTPGTPAMSTFDVDDEFNLPISVAIFILLGYIFVGATLFYMWEDWGFFESFYFVFISMSTIGFGDYVPNHPIYMMCSIVYLVFGLALTSMCINVVQVMLSDQFQQASQKIGTTIGLQIVEEDGSIHTGIPPGVEMPDIHSSGIKSKEGVAPKAKPEEVNL